MSMDSILFVLEAILFVSILIAGVFCAGIVWRVEGELDISYKCFGFAIFFFLVSEILNIYYSSDDSLILIEVGSRALFAILFCLGILFMRDIVRKLDGEKKMISKKVR